MKRRYVLSAPVDIEVSEEEDAQIQGMIEQANKQMAAIDPQKRIDFPIPPQQIEEVAERLRVVADQIK